MTLVGLLLAAKIGAASPIEVRDGAGPTINFANNTGAINHLASGIIYGLPDDQNQIPSDLLDGFGFNYGRAAGAQVGHGWTWSRSEYEVSDLGSCHESHGL